MLSIQQVQADPIAEALITALQMARQIVADIDQTRTEMDLLVQGSTLRNIEAALSSAQVTFPNAVSFKTPS
jgi:hypothetical protein